MLEAAGMKDAAFGPIVDNETALALRQHKVGDTVTVQLGRQDRSALRRRAAGSSRGR
jgi:hypothetical protein